MTTPIYNPIVTDEKQHLTFIRLRHSDSERHVQLLSLFFLARFHHLLPRHDRIVSCVSVVTLSSLSKMCKKKH